MLDRLAEIETKYEDLAEQINDPDVIANQTEWRKRMKEYSDMTPIVEKYREYKQAKEGIAESLAMLEEKQEEDFRELLKEELAENKEKAETLKQELTLLLIPKDPNDEKNVSWKSAAAQVGMRRHCLQGIYSACMRAMQSGENGR